MTERNHLCSEQVYAGMDEGIRFAVRVLNAAGVETDESCQGGSGHACHVPTVFLPCGTDSYGFAALAALVSYGLPVTGVGKVWDIQDGLPFQVRWRITFARTMEDRADERPIFTWGYTATPRLEKAS